MGVQMGQIVNPSDDAMPFVSLYDTYINPYLTSGHVDEVTFSRDLRAALTQHLDALNPAIRWGWKNPRSIYLLPLFDQMIPGLKFLHVVRNPLDMVTSRNQNQHQKHGRAVIGDHFTTLTPALASVKLWKKANETAADYGATMADRYLVVRYEELCEKPHQESAHIARRFDLPDPPNHWVNHIARSPSRWENLDPDALRVLRSELGDAMRRFGYT